MVKLPIKNKRLNFPLLLIGQIFNTFGGILFNVAVISYVYETTSSVAGATFILVLNTTASILGGFFASNFLDRISHKKVMFLSDLSSFILVLTLAIIVSLSGINIIVIYITTFMTSIISSFFLPARSAIVPVIVGKEELVKANGFLVSTLQITLTSGWVVAFPIILLVGTTNAIYLISLTYLISALLIMLLSVKHTTSHELQNKTSLFKTFKEGLTPLWENRVVRSITIMDMAESFANIVWVPTFLLSYTVEILDSSEQWWGYQGSAYFLGSILGGIFAAKYAKQIRAAGGKVLIFSSFGVAIITFAYGFNGIAILALLISFLDGPPYQIRNIVQESLLQENTESHVLGRVFSARRIILQTIYAFALFFGSLLADKIGIASTYMLAGTIYIFVAIYALSSPIIRNFNMNNQKATEKKMVGKP